MIIYTLFDTVNFSGKTVVPFNTHMGSRDGGTYKTVREKARGATAGKGRNRRQAAVGLLRSKLGSEA